MGGWGGRERERKQQPTWPAAHTDQRGAKTKSLSHSNKGGQVINRPGLAVRVDPVANVQLVLRGAQGGVEIDVGEEPLSVAEHRRVSHGLHPEGHLQHLHSLQNLTHRHSSSNTLTHREVTAARPHIAREAPHLLDVKVAVVVDGLL